MAHEKLNRDNRNAIKKNANLENDDTNALGAPIPLQCYALGVGVGISHLPEKKLEFTV